MRSAEPIREFVLAASCLAAYSIPGFTSIPRARASSKPNVTAWAYQSANCSSVASGNSSDFHSSRNEVSDELLRAICSLTSSRNNWHSFADTSASAAGDSGATGVHDMKPAKTVRNVSVAVNAAPALARSPFNERTSPTR
jgi:hypothetical protein